MDIHAGKGIILGPRDYLGRSRQGAPIPITGERATILTPSLHPVGQGATPAAPRWRK